MNEASKKTISFSEFWNSRTTICKDWELRSEENKHIVTWFQGATLGKKVAEDAQKELLEEVERFVIDVARFKDNPWKLSIMAEVMIEKLRAVRGGK